MFYFTNTLFGLVNTSYPINTLQTITPTPSITPTYLRHCGPDDCTYASVHLGGDQDWLDELGPRTYPHSLYYFSPDIRLH